MNDYHNWVNMELKKIPIILEKKSEFKFFTLIHVLENMVDSESSGLEFGVYKATTTNLMSKYLKNVYGFDSFDGLPEKWSGVAPKNLFKLKNLPKVNKNVILIKGLFQDTLDNFLRSKSELNIKFIHIDCDLYSSTKYVLKKLCEYNILKKGVIIVFDEIINYNYFLDGELKALYEVHIENNLKFEWIGTFGKIADIKQVNQINHTKKKKWNFKKFRRNGYHQEVAIRII